MAVTKKNGKDEKQNCKEKDIKQEDDHDQLQAPILFLFNLVLGVFTTFLFCYMNLAHLLAMATLMPVLVFSVFVLKVDYVVHKADHHGQPTVTELPKEEEEEEEENRVEEDETEITEVDEKKYELGQATLVIYDGSKMIPRIDKHSQLSADDIHDHVVVHDYDDDDDKKYEQEFEIDEGGFHLQSGNKSNYMKLPKKTSNASSRGQRNRTKNKKKKNNKLDSIGEGILEGVLDATVLSIDFMTGGVYSIIFQRVFS
ncbi:uncharacterized protein LOC124929185 [Impatiens glandulifera]|uniref:uncharacterized protein LOC124929185 n=1 Tax=Impatiens glandulifera TaxID=253017 RepID=UPI001FB0862B|nr:uncharacterized protein LOC124929185 [Impatiens glandulifera]XP_047325435.1 uncharacterized protein LOC124929185 [Impatiens glandulifera]